MSVESAVAAGRAAAEARMTSVCNVLRKSGTTSIVGGFKVPTWTTVHAAVPVRIAGANGGSAQSRKIDAGGLDLNVPVRVASFSVGLAGLRDGDLIEVTSGDTSDLVFRIVEVDAQDQSTAHRCQVVGTARPEEWT